MRRLTSAVTVLAALGIVALAMTVSAAAESGPRCADITNEGHNYRAVGDLSFGLTLDGAADPLVSTPCKSVVYTVTISGINGPPITISQRGDNTFEITGFTDTDNKICVSATTTSAGGKIHDAAPDAGCIEITVGTTGAGGGFN